MKRTLKPVFPSAAIEREYEKRLKKAVREMEKSCIYWLSASYKANESKILDSATDDMLQTFRRLLRQWLKKFRELADILPEWFVGKIRGYVARNLIQQTKPLRDAGLGFNLTWRYMSQAERQVFQAIIKATNNLARQRAMDYGITRGIWMHTAAGKTYRETHINDMNGVEYNIKFGCYDPDPKIERAIQPAELVNCHCVCRFVIPAGGTEERGEQIFGKAEGEILQKKVKQ